MAATKEELIAAIQKIQDSFCVVMGTQAVLTDTKGNFITKPNPKFVSPACLLIWEKSERKNTVCLEYLQKITGEAVKNKKAIIGTFCPIGFIEFAIPVAIKGEVVAVMIGCGGRRYNEKEEKELEDTYRDVAKKYKIEKYSDEFVDAVKKLRVVPEDEIRARVELLQNMLEVALNYTEVKNLFV